MGVVLLHGRRDDTPATPTPNINAGGNAASGQALTPVGAECLLRGNAGACRDRMNVMTMAAPDIRAVLGSLES
jgi:hypothetical protein